MTPSLRSVVAHLGLAVMHVGQAAVAATMAVSSRVDALLAENEDETTVTTGTATVTPLSTRRAAHGPRVTCSTCGRPLSRHVMTEDGPACLAIGVPDDH